MSTGSGQSKTSSLVEAITNIVVGASINVAMNFAVFGFFSLHISLATNVAMTALYTGVSLARSYVLRRTFNYLTTTDAANDN